MTDMEKEKKDAKIAGQRAESTGCLFPFIACLIVGLWLTWFLYYSLCRAAKDKVSGGTFGDAFGSLNALFTGLALVGVAYSVFAQRRESETRRKEFEQERNDRAQAETELKTRYEADRERAVRLEQRKSFEDHFFNLMNAFNQRVAVMKVRNFLGDTVDAHDGLSFLAEKFRHYRESHIPTPTGSDETDLVRRARYVYEEYIYKEHHSQLSAYFRMLYQIYKHVENAPFEGNAFYANIIRAGLTSDELLLLALNGLTIHSKKFRPLYSKFAILKHLNDDRLSSSYFKALKEHYGETCFADDDERKASFHNLGQIVSAIDRESLLRRLRKFRDLRQGQAPKPDV